MSKDGSNNLRLLGSPVNLSYRSKKKDDKKNIRNRPRSALQNSCCTPDIQERYKRPFSADAKEHLPSTRNFLKSFSAELLQSYNNSPNNVKILPPTTDVLGDTKINYNKTENKGKDFCSNNSDYGSEDTFMSLGTKIKAKAQVAPKTKTLNSKNILKYRNIVKKGRKPMENDINENKPNPQLFGLEVKIIEKRDNSPTRNSNIFQERSISPSFRARAYDSYFLALDSDKKIDEESLIGRVSFGNGQISNDVEQAIDTYSRRLSMTKQQLSLVEEESTQDLQSIASQNLSSLSPENSLERKASLKKKSEENADDDYCNYRVDLKNNDQQKVPNDFTQGPRTYKSFYDDFQTSSTDVYKTKLSSTVVINDASSKDSGFTDSGTNDERNYKYSLPNPTPLLKKSCSYDKIDTGQPKSLDCISLSDNGYLNTYPIDPKSWSEPLNHSRLLYKDFFLKKEGHIAKPPQNSPNKSEIHNIPGTSEIVSETNEGNEDINLEYPQYLLNSNSKAYTSKVIEDYKKEIQAINNLHELTLRDLKTDAISPTPLNIDKMFDQNCNENHTRNQDGQKPSGNKSKEIRPRSTGSIAQTSGNERDIAKVSTKELIQNYLKVKEGDYTKDLSKNLKKYDKKFSNANSKQSWNNKNISKTGTKIVSPVQVKSNSPLQKSAFTIKGPVSSRLDSVQNDKDIDSWMSLSVQSPRVFEVDDISEPPIDESSKSESNTAEENRDIEAKEMSREKNTEKDVLKTKELNSNASVLDIYSMLKEIESFGENPVPGMNNTEIQRPNKTENERNDSPKDNFMEIFEFLEKVEQSANDALSVVSQTTPSTIPKLEALLRLPATELAQRLVTASLQLEERSCCIALLQESLANHKEQMVNKVSNLEKQSLRNVARVKQECEEAIKRHQSFIDQLINDKKTLNHRIEQLVDERRSLEDRWRRSAQGLEQRYQLELRNQHDKMAAAQQVARQRWVRQKAEKIKELTVKGLEGELREMAERQQKEIADLKMCHAEQIGRLQSKHAADVDRVRQSMEEEREAALVKERQMASSRLEKQILELELTYQEQRTRLVADMRAENERVASGLSERERSQRRELEQWKDEQEQELLEKKRQVEQEIERQKERLEEEMNEKRMELEKEYDNFKQQFIMEQQTLLKQKETEIAVRHKQERDKEIEKAIESMEAEAQAGRKELQDALRRHNEQYESELKALAETEQATLRRYQGAQVRVRQTEDKCAQLEVEVGQLQMRNKVLMETNAALQSQAQEMKESEEKAWRCKVDALNQQMEDMRKLHEDRMQQLYAKVKVAVARKDSTIQALTREAAKHQEKIAMLEQKLAQQRKDFLKQHK